MKLELKSENKHILKESSFVFWLCSPILMWWGLLYKPYFIFYGNFSYAMFLGLFLFFLGFLSLFSPGVRCYLFDHENKQLRIITNMFLGKKKIEEYSYSDISYLEAYLVPNTKRRCFLNIHLKNNKILSAGEGNSNIQEIEKIKEVLSVYIEQA